MTAPHLPPPYPSEQLNRAGIYHIVHVPTGREYIGSAKCFRKRWNIHVEQLRAKEHINKRLEYSWHFRGEAEFEFHILEFVDDWSQLIVREQWHFDTYHPYYNLCPTAGSMLGYRHRFASRHKMSERAKRQRQNPSEYQTAYYQRLPAMPHSPAKAAWYVRQRGMHKNQPKTPKQMAALRIGSLMPKPVTPESLAHIRRIQIIGVAKRRGATNTPEHRAKISASCKASFAAFPPEKQEALKNQARANQLAYAKRKHENGLARQQAIWNTLIELGWMPNVPYNSWQAAARLREHHPELSQSRISEFLRWWEQEGKIKLNQGDLRTRHHPTPPPFVPPPTLAQGILFEEDAS